MSGYVPTGGQLGPSDSVFSWSVAGGGITDFADFFPSGTVAFSSVANFDFEAVIRSALNAWAIAARSPIGS